MQKIKPVGQKLIVFPLPFNEEGVKTDGGIVVMDMQLSHAEVMEVSDELKDVYSVGDTIIIPVETGTAIHYQKKSCVWISANIDVWGILTKEEK